MLKKKVAKMKSESFTCANPECGRAFVNPIIVQDLSSKNKGSYHACPYCLTEVFIEKTKSEYEKPKQKKKRTRIEEKKTPPVKVKPTKPAQPTEQPFLKEQKCPHHFGYLSQRSKKEKIPDECMTCEKIVQCMLKKVTG